jgi:phage protein D
MIFRNAYNDAPLLNVFIDRATVPDTRIVSVELIMSENKHDMAIITYSGFPGIAVTEYIGLPVSIALGNNESNMVTFIGYVAYVDVEANARMGIVNESLIQAARVVCFGASYDMKQIKSAVYIDTTLPKLVSSLAKRYKLSYSVPNNNYTFKVVEQSGKSDWELLSDTAESIGYYVMVSGTHIHVYDPFSSYFRSTPPTQLVSIGETAQRQPGSIYEFKGTFGDVTPDGSHANWSLKSFDVLRKEIEVTSTNSSSSGLGKTLTPRFTHEISMNAVSQDGLKQFVNRYTRFNFPMNAKVSVIGISTALPGRLAFVNKYDSKFDGYWIVSEVRHLVNNAHFVTTLNLKTDATNDQGLRTPPGSIYRDPPTSILSNNRWVSSREFAYVY